MPSTNKTNILGLNQWVGSDNPKRDDFNYDNQKIEEWANTIQPGNSKIWNSQNLKFEQGTWKPKLWAGTQDITPMECFGIYTVLGNFVFLNAFGNAQSKTITDTGVISITNIPFKPKYWSVGVFQANTNTSCTVVTSGNAHPTLGLGLSLKDKDNKSVTKVNGNFDWLRLSINYGI